MLHTLTVILALIGIAAIAIVILAVWTAMVSHRRERRRGQVRSPQLFASFIRYPPQLQTASQISQWLSCPGLRAPT